MRKKHQLTESNDLFPGSARSDHQYESRAGFAPSWDWIDGELRRSTASTAGRDRDPLHYRSSAAQAHLRAI
jgi:hypothetical protein